MPVMSSDEEELSIEPRQLQPYMYEPLAAAVAVVPDNAASSDESDGEQHSDPCSGSWYAFACLCLG